MSKSGLQLTDATGCVIAPLARQPLSPEAATELAIKLKALSDPIRLRLLSGLLDSERRGSWVYYRVVTDGLQQLSLLLEIDTARMSST